MSSARGARILAVLAQSIQSFRYSRAESTRNWLHFSSALRTREQSSGYSCKDINLLARALATFALDMLLYAIVEKLSLNIASVFRRK